MSTRTSRSLPLFLAGMLLLLLGAAWTSVETQRLLPRLALVSGILLLLVFIIRHASEIRFLFLQMRTHAEPGPTTTLLLTAVVLGLAGIVAIHEAPFVDLTAQRINSLSEPTRAALDVIEGPLHLDAFFVRPSPEWDLVAQYLELFARTSPQVRTSLQDPDRQPARARELEVAQAGVIVIRYGDAQTRVHLISEEEITRGILRVLEGRPRMVGFLRGHGEPALHVGGEGGITAWAEALAAANVETRPVDLVSEGAVGGDLDALILVHPRRPLYPGEISLITGYLDAGGHLGMWLEPGDSTGLERYLERNFIRILPGTLRDDGPVTERLGLGPWSPALAANPRHAIGAQMFGDFAAGPMVGPVEIISPHPMDLDILPLLKTAHTAVVMPGAEREDVEPLVPAGIQEAGVVLEWTAPVGQGWEAGADSLGLPPRIPKMRLVVVGDASMVTNRYLGVGSNRGFAVSAAQWLTEQDRYIDLHGGFRRSSQLRVSPRGLRVLLYVLQAGIPLALVALGLAVWLRRRSRS